MKTTKIKMISRTLVPVVALTTLLFASSASAVKFGVKVIGGDGKPVAGAAVCIGTHGNYKQFAATFTSSEGQVMVDVPSVPLLVTVSKTRFTGVRMEEPARRFNLVKEVKLIDGVPGPRCRAESSMADAESTKGLKIKDVKIRDGIYNVSLLPSVRGNPSHYRLSASNSFKGAGWRNYSSSIKVDPSTLKSDLLYLQVRRIKSVKGATLEAHSNIVKVEMQGL